MRGKLPVKILSGYLNQVMIGVIRSYSRQKGYGFIYSRQTRDVFVSSYDIPKKLEKRMLLGTIVKFVLKERENGRICATEIEFLDNPLAKDEIVLPDCTSIAVRHIEDFLKCRSEENDNRLALIIKSKFNEDGKTVKREAVYVEGEIYDQHNQKVFCVKEYYSYLMDLLCNYDEQYYESKFD